MPDLPVKIKRVFLWNGQRLDDLDPSLSPEEVLALWAEVHPELTNAVIEKQEPENGTQVHTFAQSSGKRAVAGGATATPRTETYVARTSQGSRG